MLGDLIEQSESSLSLAKGKISRQSSDQEAMIHLVQERLYKEVDQFLSHLREQLNAS